MSLAFKVDVTQIGMDEMREYPELGEAYDLDTNGKGLIRCSTRMWMGVGSCVDEHTSLPDQA